MSRATSENWDLLVDTESIATTQVRPVDVPEPADGQAVLRLSRCGLTANNVTYAVLGRTLRYWQFFPAPDGWGRVPLWGFADVVDSRAEGVEVGQRVYGYLPTSSHLLITPDKVRGDGFRDGAPHRSELSGVYNAYTLTTADPLYTAGTEDLQVLFRPLFTTSFALAGFLNEGGSVGAETVVLSSASSKTAYGTAVLMRGGAARLVGLTSPANVEFTRSLGCYDEVLTYDELDQLPDGPIAYVDAAGNQELRTRLHEQLGARLVLDLVLGVTHQDTGRADIASGARPTNFFAPDVIAARVTEWGPANFAERVGAAWAQFLPRAREWVDVSAGQGPAALAAAWDDVVSGRAAPRTGHVLTF